MKLTDEYSKYYAEQLIKGMEYQDYVSEILYELGLPVINYSSRKYQYAKGENKCGIEIKNDMKLKTTGNLYIETKEKSHEENINYVPSGIYRNDNSWLYIIGDYDDIYILGKKQLKTIHKARCEKQNPDFRVVTTPTSIGFLLPVDYVNRYLSLMHIQCKDKIIISVD